MFLDIFLEIVLITILLGISRYGYKRGIFRILAGPIKNLLCLFLAFNLADYAGRLLLLPLIEAPVKSYLEEVLVESAAELGAYISLCEIPLIVKVVALLRSDSLVEMGFSRQVSVDEIVNTIASPLALFISRIFAFILLFFLLKLIFKLIIHLADSFLNVGILGKINRGLGVIFSGVFAFACAWGLVLFTDYLFRLDYFSNSQLLESFDGGILYNFFSNFSPLKLLLTFNYLL